MLCQVKIWFKVCRSETETSKVVVDDVRMIEKGARHLLCIHSITIEVHGLIVHWYIS